MEISFKHNKRLFDFLRAHRDLLEALLFIRRVIFRVVFAVPHLLMVRKYLNSNKPKKLHLGAGFNVLPGWLNTDLNPGKETLYLDFTKPFPFPDASFDYVFNEHTIEHVPYSAAVGMVEKAYKALKPGGKLRVSTPNLEHLINLYQEPKTETQKKYIKWMGEAFLPQFDEVNDAIVINNYFRDWGHQFIFDEKTLKKVFEDAGFTNVTRCQTSQSSDPELTNTESHHKVIGDEFNNLESLILEGTKPAA